MPDTTRKHDGDAERKSENFNKRRIAFVERAREPDIPALAFKLAHLIAFKYMNVRTESAHPAQDTLAADLNIDDRHLRRLLHILRPLGLLIEAGNGRGRASTYCIGAPDSAERWGNRPTACG